MTSASEQHRSDAQIRQQRWAKLAVLVVPLLTFARAVPFPLTHSWDDGRFIVDNPDVLHPSWDAWVRMLTTVQFEAYHPLHLLSYWLDVPWVSALGDPQLTAAAVHTVSLMLWLYALQLSYELMSALGAPPWAAALGTLLFGIHPAQVEVVSWASGRKDVLALLFVAASLRMQLSATGAFDARAWLARGLFLCAVLSKTTALPLPLFALGIDWIARKRTLRAALLWQLPSLLIGIAVGGAVLAIWREHSMLRQTLGDESMALVRAWQTLGHQLLTAVWPSRVSPIYSTRSVGQWQLAPSLASGLYVLACMVALRSQYRLTAVGLVGFGVWLLPASNLVPLYFPLQDRYASLPLFSLGIALAGLAVRAQPFARGRLTSGIARRSQPGFWRGLGYLAVLGLSLRTVQYEGAWKSELRLWGHAARAQPDADYAYLKLGEVRREAGDLEGAIGAYHAAIQIAPMRKLAHAALFEVVARRDERRHHIKPSRARQLAQQYYRCLSDRQALRAFPGQLWSMGYERAAELPLHAVLALDGVPQSAIRQSALSALRAGRTSLARFYVHALRKAPASEPLASVYAEPYFRVVP